jgi:hypothetical protein
MPSHRHNRQQATGETVATMDPSIPSTNDGTKQMERIPLSSNCDVSSRLREENEQLNAEVAELRERLSRHEQDERERRSMYRTGHQWQQQSWMMGPNHQFTASQEDSDIGSHSTLTEQDASLDTEFDRSHTHSHDRTLNGPSTFCKQPSEASRRSASSTQKGSDVEEATTATTATEDPSIRIAHDPAFETNYKDESFFLMMAEQAGWLVGLLLFQSVSSFVLEENQSLLQSYPVIVKFLTMLVGAGYVREYVTDCALFASF